MQRRRFRQQQFLHDMFERREPSDDLAAHARRKRRQRRDGADVADRGERAGEHGAGAPPKRFGCERLRCGGARHAPQFHMGFKSVG